MLRLAPVLVVLLAACNSEPSFDERYVAAEKSIRDKAATMDAEMTEQERLRGQGTPGAAPATPEGGGVDQNGLIKATK